MKTKHEIIDRLAEIGRQIRILELEEFALIRKLYKMKHIISCESEPIKLTDNTSQIDGLS